MLNSISKSAMWRVQIGGAQISGAAQRACPKPQMIRMKPTSDSTP